MQNIWSQVSRPIVRIQTRQGTLHFHFDCHTNEGKPCDKEAPGAALGNTSRPRHKEAKVGASRTWSSSAHLNTDTYCSHCTTTGALAGLMTTPENTEAMQKYTLATAHSWRGHSTQKQTEAAAMAMWTQMPACRV